MGNASCRCAGGRQRVGRDAVHLGASMGGQRTDQRLTEQSVSEPVSASTLDDQASRKRSIERVERGRLIHPADGRELVRSELLTSDRGPLDEGTNRRVQAE